MKRRRFSIEQIVTVLKQAEPGMPLADLIRRVGIPVQTFYGWKKPCAGMQSDRMREHERLQDEKARLQKRVVQPSLGVAILQDAASKM
ncbi:transposase [Burkholderia gladioli]|uniref:transposase n=1 Tax=Burkholderia gladioli TaxID=28095 RepID=UPI003EE1BE45